MFRLVDYAPLILFKLLLILLPAILCGQDLYVGADQLLYVSEGAILHLDNGLENTGSLDNSGEIEVQGDWQNTGSYIANNGQLIMAGDGPQRLDHRGQAFSRLHINNPQGVRIRSDVVIRRELNLAAGVVTTTDNVSIILQANSEVLGAGPEAYVNGRLISEGTGYKFFPVGNANIYLPLELLEVQGTDPVIGVQIREPHPEAQSLDGLALLNRSFYWQAQTLDGIYEGSLIRLGFAGLEDFENTSGLVVAEAARPGGAYVSLGESELLGTIAEGSITSLEPGRLPVIALAKSDQFSVEGEVLVPNAFAPGSPVAGDRHLSIFTVNLLPDQFVFRVFNRWGQIVYETESLDEARDNGWNGINQQTSQPAQFGVYSYYLSGIFSSGQPVVKKGTLTLFR